MLLSSALLAFPGHILELLRAAFLNRLFARFGGLLVTLPESLPSSVCPGMLSQLPAWCASDDAQIRPRPSFNELPPRIFRAREVTAVCPEMLSQLPGCSRFGAKRQNSVFANTK